MNEANTNLKKCYESKNFILIDCSKPNESCLNNSKSHLSNKSLNIWSQNIEGALQLHHT